MQNLRNQSTQFKNELIKGKYLPFDDSYTMQKFSKKSQETNQKRMKKLVEQMRFKQKIDSINKKKGRFKRSTNNCHKKYIGILKNLVFLKINCDIKNQILNQFNRYKNSRVYYFIILCYLKWYLTSNEIRWVFHQFSKDVESKIGRYRLQIEATSNANFINFRKDQIIEMEYSIHSINYFLRGNVSQAIKMLYQKNKYIIIKRNQYLKTCQIIQDLEKKLSQKFANVNANDKLANLNLEELYSWKKQHLLEVKQQNKRNHSHAERYHTFNQYEPVCQKYSSENQKALNQQPLFKKQEKSIKIEQNRLQNHLDPVMMPLIGLQNSYPMISEITWFNLIAEKQKQVEMYLKFKEENLSRIYAQYRMNQYQKHFFHFAKF